ncbi:MAG: peptidoglycan DD-metalloendopeptidase family protein [Bdellovibrionales bacterium]|nr:peptidoglycan DD-metalloendopeptidase family protein [Bdellovibrionales bacterium]
MLLGLAFSIQIAAAEPNPAEKSVVADQIQSARASISETEKQQREALSHLFVINQRIKDMAKKSARLNNRAMEQEGHVRVLAQDVRGLEDKSQQSKDLLNRRLRQLYHDRSQNSFQWLFSAQTPVEMERNHRFLKLMIDSDHKQLKRYLTDLRELRAKRSRLKGMVGRLAEMQKELQTQEAQLTDQMRIKSRMLAELKKSKDSKLSELKGLRQSNKDLSGEVTLAFFERKGSLRPPIDARLAREFGTFVDPTFRFRLMHKGLFYSASSGGAVNAIYAGRVALATSIPGFGKTVILDHGDNYYSVYAFCSQLKVREGSEVRDGDLVALSGSGSPLFGPGLYFEIRHFTDAVDPRSWIKEPGLRTAHAD